MGDTVTVPLPAADAQEDEEIPSIARRTESIRKAADR